MDQHWRIGVDEAGYGPNLGPLVVAATAWRAPVGCDLYELFAEAITAASTPGDARLFIADSKAVYAPGGGLALLERGVYAVHDVPSCWLDFVESLGADGDGWMSRLAWHDGFNPKLPLDACSENIASAARRLSGMIAAHRVGATRIAARMVHPAEFNRLVAEHGTKGAALSHLSIGLARRLSEQVAKDEDPVAFTFDKHGGRNRYGALLQEHFPEGWIETRDEARAVSRYRQGERFSFTFRTKGEAELPVALASMTAKLLRELSMKAFNAYWATHVPGIKPTAGYPLDARRFKAAIAAKQAELGIDDDVLWRSR
ncbi:hypothetical protein [Botrimarina mediterranea]|uniref:Uncharacterized protein n=1 Tax=Botrimarina mediterranea TaxID=2528022 RepID=A0A518KES0_9BACT|nr:hypothetical protein [Botrimarina mediterranea]QDV76280.1 Hypothetical protein Spa11_45100 [Botrimarina mediterranea]QDV80878.1 Hypothetical protein K2D_45130 [Planctomycetes bacterium K2D]